MRIAPNVRCTSYIFKNRIVPLQEILGAKALEIQDQLNSDVSLQTKIGIIESFLWHLQVNQDTWTRERVKSPNSYIQMGSEPKLSNVYEEFCITARTLENRFKNQVGISPKEFSNVSKFCFFISRMRKEKLDLTNLSYESGYYDQSHAIRFFKEIMGITPTEYQSLFGPFDQIKLQVLASEITSKKPLVPNQDYSFQ